jgi:ATP-dependent DNA ligase
MLPAHSAIIDAEIVVCDSDGRPDFNALMRGETDDLCAWCFDLLDLDDRDLRRSPLTKRKALLNHLLIEADDHVLRYSTDFSDPHALLLGVERLGLEGIVSKKKNQQYRSGKNPGWVKVKCPTWARGSQEPGRAIQQGWSRGTEGPWLLKSYGPISGLHTPLLSRAVDLSVELARAG